MEVKFNGTEENTGFDVMPNGRYEAEVISLVEKISKAGNEMTEVCFEIVTSEGARRLLWTYLVPNPKGLFACRRFVEACGMEWEKDTPLQIDESYKGSMIALDVTSEMYEGTRKNKVKFAGFNKLEGSGVVKGGVPF